MSFAQSTQDSPQSLFYRNCVSLGVLPLHHPQSQHWASSSPGQAPLMEAEHPEKKAVISEVIKCEFFS